MKNKFGHYLFILCTLIILSAACTATPRSNPPATLQAAVAGTELLTDTDISTIEVLQEKTMDDGQVMLYRWTNDAEQVCLSAAYMTTINGRWQTHDTLSAGCHTNSDFVAAYTGNSHIESPFGSIRHTTAYGSSSDGHAVRIVWSDGQVTYLPLDKGTFLETRDGRWVVERVELLDRDNNVLLVEEWQTTVMR